VYYARFSVIHRLVSFSLALYGMLLGPRYSSTIFDECIITAMNNLMAEVVVVAANDKPSTSRKVTEFILSSW
jgi:hypothetical protein